MGDKLFLNFGAKFQRLFIISHVKLQNCLLTHLWEPLSSLPPPTILFLKPTQPRIIGNVGRIQ